MRIFRVMLLGGLVVLFGGVALADPVPIRDPEIVLVGTDPTSTPVEGLSFSFFANNQGIGIFPFQNISGRDWFNVAILTSPPTPCSSIVGRSNVFGNFSCQDLSGGQVQMLFSGVGTFGELFFPGIVNGAFFTINLGPLTDPWTANERFDAQANVPVPEPATLALFLTGLGALVMRRKLL